MKNIPLDFPLDFSPAEDDRPAGQWMEGYWADIARWAKRFAIAILTYFGWLIINDAIYFLTSYSTLEGLYFIVQVLALLTDFSVAFLGFFCLRFGQYLEGSLAAKDQVLLEKSFRQLHWFLHLGLLVACIWMYSSVIQWQTTIQFTEHSEYIDVPMPLLEPTE